MCRPWRAGSTARHRRDGPHRRGGRARRHGERGPRWPLLGAGLLPALALLGGIAGIYSDATATNIAVFLAGVNLVGWGVVVGRAQQAGLLRVVMSTLFTTVCTILLGLLYVSVH